MSRPYGRIKYGPLTQMQKLHIETMALNGHRDREIATRLGIGEYQVGEYRRAWGGASAKHHRGDNVHGMYDPSLRGLRPAHVIGSAGDECWFRSCNDAFVQAVMQAGAW